MTFLNKKKTSRVSQIINKWLLDEFFHRFYQRFEIFTGMNRIITFVLNLIFEM
jgi:hypothetical protein